MPKYETRATEPFEIREEGGKFRVTGHAAVFEQEANIAGFFREKIMPGAFQKSLREQDDVVFLVNHDDLPLARTSSGTLSLREDKTGLRIDSELDPTDPDVMRIVPKMKRGDLSKMSFAFRARDEEWVEPERGSDDLPLRIIREADLFDVSIVTQPAYDGTDIALRSRDKAKESDEAEKERNLEAAKRRIRMKYVTDFKVRNLDLEDSE